MLLPSVFHCGAQPGQSSQPPQRPKLLSLGAHGPTSYPQTQPSTSAASLLASCRALHSILCGPQPATSRPSTDLQKRTLHNPTTKRRPLQDSPVTPQRPPRGALKRRRSTIDSSDEENLPSLTSSKTTSRTSHTSRDTFSTPKRRRLVPLSMPLGLTADDFHSLTSPVPVTPIDLPSPPFLDSVFSPPEHNQGRESEDDPCTAWTLDDDKALVATVLEKLKLSKREWNDCARKLGKDQDSLGRRWRALLGEGEVGLRRGRRCRRVDLDIGSW